VSTLYLLALNTLETIAVERPKYRAISPCVYPSSNALIIADFLDAISSLVSPLLRCNRYTMLLWFGSLFVV